MERRNFNQHTKTKGEKMINRKCTNLNDSLAKAIERVCKEKDKENKDKKEKK